MRHSWEEHGAGNWVPRMERSGEQAQRAGKELDEQSKKMGEALLKKSIDVALRDTI